MWLNLPIKLGNSTVNIFVVMFDQKLCNAGKSSLVECFLKLQSIYRRMKNNFYSIRRRIP